eukprot:TRINITY_DN5337_c0_g1_i1.p1 TRINITY_DN5337_c0_g1~~TRINITY_DN5337_c0_g1_i1.p1  ORF type:complete len:139 (+),score=21.83 TRINITY_DN5337_c0_g1_i1:37-417(+)
MRFRRRCSVIAGAALAWNACFISPTPGPITLQRGRCASVVSEPITDSAGLDSGFGSVPALGLGLVAGACGVQRCAAVPRRGFLAMGQEAPRFTLPDENGNKISLEDLVQKGMQVLIWWYPKAGTPG